MDIGSVLYGEEAVSLGLIARLGGLSDALECLHGQLEARKKETGPEEPREEESGG